MDIQRIISFGIRVKNLYESDKEIMTYLLAILIWFICSTVLVFLGLIFLIIK